MTGPIKQKRAASGYELLKGDDDLVTTGRRADVSWFEGRSSEIDRRSYCRRPLAESEW